MNRRASIKALAEKAVDALNQADALCRDETLLLDMPGFRVEGGGRTDYGIGVEAIMRHVDRSAWSALLNKVMSLYTGGKAVAV